jgi:hypothetical protein
VVDAAAGADAFDGAAHPPRQCSAPTGNAPSTTAS